MNTLMLALCLLLPQEEAQPAPQVTEAALEKKIAERQERRASLDRKIREAVERGNVEEAQTLTQEHKDNEREMETLRKQLADLRAKKPKGREWYDNINFEAVALLTHWDNDLELDDGFGWGAAMYVRDFMFFEYRRWDADDELGDGDATVQSYQLGFTYEFDVAQEKTTAFLIGGGIGLIHFASDAPGSDGDTGPIISFNPTWKFYFSKHARFNVGGDIDILRTDFNQRRTHTDHNFSLMLSIELAL